MVNGSDFLLKIHYIKIRNCVPCFRGAFSLISFCRRKGKQKKKLFLLKPSAKYTRNNELLQSATASRWCSSSSRLSTGRISQGRLSATGISPTRISSELSSSGIPSSLRPSICSASPSSAKAEFWLLRRLFGRFVLLLPSGCLLLTSHLCQTCCIEVESNGIVKL